MRADRLLSILLLLQTRRRMTARDLAQRLEVSSRTIHRDMEALCAAGIPIYAERGAHGGWVLAEPYRTDLTGLNEAEVQALFLATPPRLLADLGLSKAAEAALVKLLAALPSTHRREAQHSSQRIHIDPSGWRRAEEAVPCLPALQDAVWRERRVLLTYRRGDGSEVERGVDPLGLVAKGSLWYLVAAVDGETRTYRVSRVRSAVILDEPSRRPDGFDLAAYWAESTAQFVAAIPRYPVVARVRPDMLPRVRSGGNYVRVERVEPPDTDGWSTVHLTIDSEGEACGFVLGFGAALEIVEPASLRERVAAIAADVVRLYAPPSKEVDGDQDRA